MYARVQDRRLFVALFIALVAMAWLALWTWGRSPYDRYLRHDTLGSVSLRDDPALLLFFVAGWTLMIVAMMLPTSLPLIMLFHGLVRQRADRRRLQALLVTGYLAVWTAFGLAVHVGDAGIHALVNRSLWLAERSWMIAAATLVVAGLYQFSPLKYRCMEQCQAPLSFILSRWRGRADSRQALRLGLDHGLFCLGCCWALMLLMFAVGEGNFGWMLVLGAVMATEKNLPGGQRLSAPLGVILVGWGAATFVLQGQL